MRAATVAGMAVVTVALGSAQAGADEPPPVPWDPVPLQDMPVTTTQVDALYDSLLPDDLTIAVAGDSYWAGLGAGNVRRTPEGVDMFVPQYWDPADPRSQSKISAPMQGVTGFAQSMPGTRITAYDLTSAGATIANYAMAQRDKQKNLINPPQIEGIPPGTDIALLGFGGNTIGFGGIVEAAFSETLTGLDFSDLVGKARPKLNIGLTPQEYITQAQTSPPGTAPTVTAQVIDMIMTMHEQNPDMKMVYGTYPDFLDPEEVLDESQLSAEEVTIARQVLSDLNDSIMLGAMVANSMCGGCTTIADIAPTMTGDNALYGSTAGVHDFGTAFGWGLGHKVAETMHPTGWGARLMAVPINQVLAGFYGLPQSVFPTWNGLPNQPPYTARPLPGMGWSLENKPEYDLRFTLPEQVPNLTVLPGGSLIPQTGIREAIRGYLGRAYGPRWSEFATLNVPGPSPTGMADWTDLVESGMITPIGSPVAGAGYTGFAPDLSGLVDSDSGSFIESGAESGWADSGQSDHGSASTDGGFVDGSGYTGFGPDLSGLADSGSDSYVDGGGAESGWADPGEMSSVPGSGVTSGADLSPLTGADHSDIGSTEPYDPDSHDFGGSDGYSDGYGGYSGGSSSDTAGADSGGGWADMGSVADSSSAVDATGADYSGDSYGSSGGGGDAAGGDTGGGGWADVGSVADSSSAVDATGADYSGDSYSSYDSGGSDTAGGDTTGGDTGGGGGWADVGSMADSSSAVDATGADHSSDSYSSYDSGSYGSGSYDSGSYDSAGYDSGGYGSGGYGGGGYDSGSAVV